jgi:hypothetical protein
VPIPCRRQRHLDLPNQYHWHTVASTFSAFVEDLGLDEVQATV